MIFFRFKLRPSGIPNPALPEGGSTGAGNSTSATLTPAASVRLLIRPGCSGGSSSLPTMISGSGPSGAAEALAKDLLKVHPDPQRLTRAILTASSSYSNISNVQVLYIHVLIIVILCLILKFVSNNLTYLK